MDDIKLASEIYKCSQADTELAIAMLELIKCDCDLNKAKGSVPYYTGQYNPKDYYAEEQEKWNIAAEKFAGIVRTL